MVRMDAHLDTPPARVTSFRTAISGAPFARGSGFGQKGTSTHRLVDARVGGVITCLQQWPVAVISAWGGRNRLIPRRNTAQGVPTYAAADIGISAYAARRPHMLVGIRRENVRNILL